MVALDTHLLPWLWAVLLLCCQFSKALWAPRYLFRLPVCILLDNRFSPRPFGPEEQAGLCSSPKTPPIQPPPLAIIIAWSPLLVGSYMIFKFCWILMCYRVVLSHVACPPLLSFLVELFSRIRHFPKWAYARGGYSSSSHAGELVYFLPQFNTCYFSDGLLQTIDMDLVFCYSDIGPEGLEDKAMKAFPG